MNHRTLGLATSLAAAGLLTACGSSSDSDSSNRGSGTETDPVSIENAFIVPRSVNGACALQIGDAAGLRYVVSNSSTTDADRLLSITTPAAERVEITPNTPVTIPIGATVASGPGGTPGGSTPVTTRLVGLSEAARPGTSFDVSFRFAEAGTITLPVAVEACPVQGTP